MCEHSSLSKIASATYKCDACANVLRLDAITEYETTVYLRANGTPFDDDSDLIAVYRLADSGHENLVH